MPNREDTSFFFRHGGVVFPAIAILWCGAAAEGLTAAFLTLYRNGTVLEAFLGFVFGGGLTITMLLPLGAALVFVLSRESVRGFGSQLGRGLKGDQGSIAVPIFLLSLQVVALGPVGAVLGRNLFELMTPFFASLALVVITVAFLLISILVTVPLSRFLNRRLPLPDWTESSLAAAVFLLVGALVFAVSAFLLPLSFVILPSFMVLGAGVGFFPGGVSIYLDAVSRKKARIGTSLALFVWLGLSLFALPLLPEGTRQALLYDAKYVGTYLSVLGSALDSDGDGFSKWFLGGDCNDADPRVHPNARDIPLNGIDENCSGLDAVGFVPPKRPAAKIPEALRGKKTNIVFVLVDALRPDHLGINGYFRPTSPNLDEFIEDALWFPRAYTPAPRTQAAMTTLFTGRDIRQTPHKNTGGTSFLLKSNAVTMAEVLKKQGYDTVGYTISYVIQHKKGLGQGFRIWQTPWPTEAWRKAFFNSGEVTTKAALNYLQGKSEEGDEPFFLFTHYRCTHDPYYKHPPWDFGDETVDLYDSALAYCDSEIGKLLRAISKRKDAERTAVFLFSDHGELFGDHGYTHHGHSLYEADVSILLSARIPGTEPGVFERPVSLADLPVTALSLAGQNPDSFKGFNLLSYADRARIPKRPIFMFTDLVKGRIRRNVHGVLSWPYKFIHDRKSKKKELFNVARDPLEVHDLQKKAPNKAAELAELLESYEAYLHTPPPKRKGSSAR